MLFDDLQHRGDLRLGEDSLGERIADLGSADRGARTLYANGEGAASVAFLDTLRSM